MAVQKSKSFWSKPEGVTGTIVLMSVIFGVGFMVVSSIAAVIAFLTSTAGMIVSLLALGLLIFMALDGKSRALASYLYKSTMRWITSWFIQLDPIAILKGYITELKDNLKNMNKQIVKLRGQMHRLKEMIINNQKEIDSNLTQASQLRDKNEKAQMILKSRKAGRLQDSNLKLDELYKKMEIMYRVLNKMYQNSAILAEDIEDQVKVKEQERRAITAGHSAMKSAMNIIKGDSDKKAMFDTALEAIADDVANKVGEMEQFMSLSENFMQSIDLQNGVFEEKGLKMLEQWEKQSDSLLLGDEKDLILTEIDQTGDVLDLSTAPEPLQQRSERKNQYDSFFD